MLSNSKLIGRVYDYRGPEGKSAGILREPNIGETWPMNKIVTRKLRNFGYVKRHNSLERTMIESVVPGRWEGRLMRRLIQDIEDILGA